MCHDLFGPLLRDPLPAAIVLTQFVSLRCPGRRDGPTPGFIQCEIAAGGFVLCNSQTGAGEDPVAVRGISYLDAGLTRAPCRERRSERCGWSPGLERERPMREQRSWVDGRGVDGRRPLSRERAGGQGGRGGVVDRWGGGGVALLSPGRARRLWLQYLSVSLWPPLGGRAARPVYSRAVFTVSPSSPRGRPAVAPSRRTLSITGEERAPVSPPPLQCRLWPPGAAAVPPIEILYELRDGTPMMNRLVEFQRVFLSKVF